MNAPRWDDHAPAFWNQLSPWAHHMPGSPLFTRAMDWAVLAVIEGQGDLFMTAHELRVPVGAVMTRMHQLRETHGYA